jgi:hypothetical protein
MQRSRADQGKQLPSAWNRVIVPFQLHDDIVKKIPSIDPVPPSLTFCMKELNMTAKVNFDFGLRQPLMECFCALHRSEDTEHSPYPIPCQGFSDFAFPTSQRFIKNTSGISRASSAQPAKDVPPTNLGQTMLPAPKSRR